MILKKIIFCISISLYAVIVQSETTLPHKGRLEDSETEDIVAFQKCLEEDCSKKQQAVFQDISLAIEYISVIDCMKYREECLRVDKQQQSNGLKIEKVIDCLEKCYNFKPFSKDIQTLNHCNISCAEQVKQTFKSKQLSSFDDILGDPNLFTKIFLYSLLCVTIIFCLYLLFKKYQERNNLINEATAFNTNKQQQYFIEATNEQLNESSL